MRYIRKKTRKFQSKLRERYLQAFIERYYRSHEKYSLSADIPEQKTIPKIIHYCWFGGNPDSEMKIRCMESWQKHCPDYKLHLWDETNFPFADYPFANQALNDKKWAYVSDVARLHSLYYYGGIYMDTDVELFAPVDRFLENEFFSGFEADNRILTALMGCKAGNKYLEKLLLWYVIRGYNRTFYKIPNTQIISRFTEKLYNIKLDGREFELPCGARFYPEEYFCRSADGMPGKYAQHHFEGSWV